MHQNQMNNKLNRPPNLPSANSTLTGLKTISHIPLGNNTANNHSEALKEKTGMFINRP